MPSAVLAVNCRVAVSAPPGNKVSWLTDSFPEISGSYESTRSKVVSSQFGLSLLMTVTVFVEPSPGPTATLDGEMSTVGLLDAQPKSTTTVT